MLCLVKTQKKLQLVVIVLLFCLNTRAQVAFPLRLSENKRYLVDNNNSPFLIKEFSAWGMIQALSENDESAFLDSIKQKGFNAILTSVVSNAPSQMGGNPPYWQGISPFTTQWDFSKSTMLNDAARSLMLPRIKIPDSNPPAKGQKIYKRLLSQNISPSTAMMINPAMSVTRSVISIAREPTCIR